MLNKTEEEGEEEREEEHQSPAGVAGRNSAD